MIYPVDNVNNLPFKKLGPQRKIWFKKDIPSTPVIFKSKVEKYFGLKDLYTEKGV